MGGAAQAKPKRASRARPAKAAPTPARIALAEECTLRDAPALQAQLIALRASANAVIVDAAAVRRIDTAALQLLVAFVRREQAAGHQVQWPAPSAEFLEASHRLGLPAALGLPVARGSA